MSTLVPAYIKTAYKDDPTFKDTKVIYSLYNEKAGIDLGQEFVNIAVTGDMTSEDVEPYGSSSYKDLYTGALSYSDAVVVTTGDKLSDDLLNIVKNQEIPVFDLADDGDFENYCDLYDQFSSEELEETVGA